MQALRAGATPEQVLEATKIDPWFVDQLVLLLEVADHGRDRPRADRRRCCGRPSGTASPTPRSPPSGTCARTWSAASAGPSASGRSTRPSTPARPSSPPGRRTTTAPTTTRPRSQPRTRPAVLILGSGPNRIGQGIEFDYSCVHAAMALSDAGYETIMVNCNPETVSTDYDTADRLYFEPLTLRGRARGRARRAAGRPDRRGDRPARRADPAAAGPGPQGRRGADRRHQPGGDPPGRGAGRVRPGAGRGRTCRPPSTAWPAPSPRPR